MKRLRHKLIQGATEIIILHLLKEQPLTHEEAVQKILKKFDVLLNHAFVFSLLGEFKSEGIVFSDAAGQLVLTEKGDLLRTKLIENYTTLNESIRSNLMTDFFLF